MKIFKAGLFYSLAFLMTFLALEVLLSGASFLFPHAEMVLAQSNPLLIKDETLLWKGNSGISGHDKAGFRNQKVLERADIVVLGDSQSYGFGLDGSLAWPEQLKRKSGLSVYSFALPGYGPVQQLTLIDRALSLQPKKVIYALYTGNDFYESYAVVYDSQKRSDLKSSEPEALKEILRAENEKPLLSEIKSLEAACGAFQIEPQKIGLKGQIAAHSKVYGLLRAVYRVFKKSEADLFSQSSAKGKTPSECMPFESGDLKTFFTPLYRLTGLNQNDPRIEEGFQITVRILREISEKAKASGAEFLVLLIPTKESVFYKKASREISGLPQEYQKLAASESFYLEELSRVLEKENIKFKNLLPDFEAALELGVQPYFDSSDNHLNEAGQRLTAEAADLSIQKFKGE